MNPNYIGYNYSDRIEEYHGYFGEEYARYRNNEKTLTVRIKRFIKLCDLFGQSEPRYFFILIDSYGNVIKNAYGYLNKKLVNSSYNVRENAITALKLLYSFFELFSFTSEKEMDKETLVKLEAFLRGVEDEYYHFKTRRSNSTINNYYHVYREYFCYLNIPDNVFSDAINVLWIDEKSSNRNSSIVKKYRVSNHVEVKKTVPKYISYNEYVSCVKYIQTRNKPYWINLRDTLIIHLMYEYGFRIGEVCGLTLEDFYNTLDTNSKHGRLIIRNRFTDTKHQLAKGCMNISSRADYSLPSYKTPGFKNAGFQVVDIEETTVNMIEWYLNETVLSTSLSATLARNLREKNNADSVSNRESIRNNKYIFVSKNMTPLHGWNRCIKEIYLANGINCDEEVKKDGLSHKCRHGFAMYKVLFEKYDRLKLKYAMRHSSIDSCEAYFNPTAEDLARLAHTSDALLRNRGLKFG